MATKHVIIGNGPAGMHAIESIRKYEPSGSEIHLISDEPAYSRMVLPYWITGQIDEDHLFTANDDFYQKHAVTAHTGRVTAVDPNTKTVTIDDNRTLEFDNLLIATGSSPAQPSIEGSDLPGVQNLWSLEDARAILPRIGDGKRVLFVGAGFIGFIILNALFKKKCSLAVVELADQILPKMLDGASACLAQGWLESRGIAVHTGTSLAKIEASGSELKATLQNGSEVETDSVVLSVGVRPNTSFLDGSGIKVDHGITVNNQLQTNFSNIFAAGDCAQGPDLMNGQTTVHAIQPTSVDHGRIAGANMAGQGVEYDGSLLMNVLDICGLQAASFGKWDYDSDCQTIHDAARPVFRKINFDQDQIVGAIVLAPTGDVSMINDIGMIKGFIQTKTKLGEWKDYLAKHPTDVRRPYMATGVAAKLLNKTLLPSSSEDVGFRYQDAQPSSDVDRGPHHATFAETWAEIQGESG